MHSWIHGEKCIFTHIYIRKIWHPYRVDAEEQILIIWIHFSHFCALKMKKNTKIWGFSRPSLPDTSNEITVDIRVYIRVHWWNYFAARTRRLKLTYYSSSISAIFGFTFSNQSSYSRYMWSSLIKNAILNYDNFIGQSGEYCRALKWTIAWNEQLYCLYSHVGFTVNSPFWSKTELLAYD